MPLLMSPALQQACLSAEAARLSALQVLLPNLTAGRVAAGVGTCMT